MIFYNVGGSKMGTKSPFLAILLFLVAFLTAVSTVHADNCKGKNYEGKQKSDSRDPCGEKKMNIVAAGVEVTAATIHGVAGAICLACFAGNPELAPKCKWTGRIAGGFDVIGALSVQAAKMSVAKKFNPEGSVGLIIGLGTGMGSLIMSFKDFKEGSTDEELKSDCGWGAFLHGVFTVAQGATAGLSAMQAMKADKNKKEMISDAAELQATNNANMAARTSSSSKAPILGGVSSVGNQDSNTDGDQNAAAEAQTLASTAALNELSKEFENATGKPASGIITNMQSGMNPMVAAAHAAGDSIPNGTQSAQHLTDLAKELLANNQFKEQVLASTAGSERFEAANNQSGNSNYSTVSKTVKAPVKKSPLDGLSEALSGLLPKEEKKEEPAPKTDVNFGGRTTASEANKEGFHQSNESIFRVINSRYKNLNQTVLNEGF